MPGLYDNNEHPRLAERISNLETMVERLCDRFDDFEKVLSRLDNSLRDVKSELEANGSFSGIKDAEEKLKNAVPSMMNGESNGIFDEAMVVETVYCGPPEGSGFYEYNMYPESAATSLFVIKKVSERKAYFYPLSEKFPRFRNNAESLLKPVCDIEGDIKESESFIIEKDGYGLLALKENDYWSVTKKCIISVQPEQ